LTPAKAKKIVKRFLDENKLTYDKITAKTIGFSDLARCSRVFVTIHNMQPNTSWKDLTEVSRDNGFYVDFR